MSRTWSVTAAVALGLVVGTLVLPDAASSFDKADSCATAAESIQERDSAPLAGCCVSQTKYAITNSSPVRMRFSDVPTFRNGPGGTLSVTRSYSGSTTFTITVGASIDVGPVLAQAKLSVDASLMKSNSTSATNTYSRKITAGKFGNVQYVSYGKRVSFRKYRLNADCSTTTLTSSGSITYPSSVEGWYYWETSG